MGKILTEDIIEKACIKSLCSNKNYNHINAFLAKETLDSKENILETCKDEFEQVLIIGWTKEDLMSAKSTASLDIKDIIYMVEVFKSVIITAGHDVE